jgi:hypothetical protein
LHIPESVPEYRPIFVASATMSTSPVASFFSFPVSCALHVSHSLAHRLAEEAFPDLSIRLTALVEGGRIHTSLVPTILATAFFWSLAAASGGAFSSFRPEDHLAAVLLLVGFVPPGHIEPGHEGETWCHQVQRSTPTMGKKACRPRKLFSAPVSLISASTASDSPVFARSFAAIAEQEVYPNLFISDLLTSSPQVEGRGLA